MKLSKIFEKSQKHAETKLKSGYNVCGLDFFPPKIRKTQDM